METNTQINFYILVVTGAMKAKVENKNKMGQSHFRLHGI